MKISVIRDVGVSTNIYLAYNTETLDEIYLI